MSWTLHEVGGPGPGRALALTVDPVARRVTVGHVVLGAGDARVANRAVYRALVERVDQGWLGSAQALTLLTQVDEGFRSTTMWSGDVVGDWTEEAWTAAEELCRCAAR